MKEIVDTLFDHAEAHCDEQTKKNLIAEQEDASKLYEEHLASESELFNNQFNTLIACPQCGNDMDGTSCNSCGYTLRARGLRTTGISQATELIESSLRFLNEEDSDLISESDDEGSIIYSWRRSIDGPIEISEPSHYQPERENFMGSFSIPFSTPSSTQSIPTLFNLDSRLHAEVRRNNIPISSPPSLSFIQTQTQQDNEDEISDEYDNSDIDRIHLEYEEAIGQSSGLQNNITFRTPNNKSDSESEIDDYDSDENELHTADSEIHLEINNTRPIVRRLTTYLSSSPYTENSIPNLNSPVSPESNIQPLEYISFSRESNHIYNEESQYSSSLVGTPSPNSPQLQLQNESTSFYSIMSMTSTNQHPRQTSSSIHCDEFYDIEGSSPESNRSGDSEGLEIFYTRSLEDSEELDMEQREGQDHSLNLIRKNYNADNIEYEVIRRQSQLLNRNTVFLD